MVEEIEKNSCEVGVFHPEYGSWVVEGTPAEPYTLSLSGKADEVLDSLKNRRKFLNEMLEKKNAKIVSMPAFPSLGEGDFFDSD